MDSLIAALLETRKRADRSAKLAGARNVLELLGDPDPTKAGTAVLGALEHPDLSSEPALWLGGLLSSARPGFAASCLVDLANRYRDLRHSGLDLRRAPSLSGLLGCSDFLARLLLRHPNWADELEGDTPGPPAAGAVEPDWTSIRIAKYKGLLRIAARDLSGRPFESSLTELSDLADRCLVAALECAAREAGTPPPTLFALGKLGARELNFSSDVDLLFLHESSADPSNGLEGPARSAEATRLVQHLKRHLESASEDGFGYRVDLDLRPEGRQGVLVNSVDAALAYYESFGVEWERQMLLRLRYIAGPGAAARSFCSQVEPFVYRRLIDASAIERVREMKRKIESERRAAGQDLDFELKEGPGGIRDVEFLVQALQLFHGGRTPALRGGSIPEVLEQLARSRILPEETTAQLHAAYLWLRRAEHCVQLVEERQTHRFPKDSASQLRLARRMGYAATAGHAARDQLLADWERTREQVRASFASLILEPSSADAFGRRVRVYLEGGPLLERFSISAEPFLSHRLEDDAIPEIEGGALAGLARVLASQAEASRYAAHRPGLLERLAAAGPETLSERGNALASAPAAAFGSDLEAFLDWLRLTRRDETELAACLDLGAVVDFEAVSRFLSQVAEACVRWALDEASRRAAGTEVPPISVVGMGKVAGRELTYHSDLDLIFLYPDDWENAALAARTAQRLIHYLTTMTGAGTVFAVDARLRPSGRQGALVSTFSAFAEYQRKQAATWEHLALMRSRVIAADGTSAQQLLGATREAVLRERSGAAWPEIAEMRARIERERARGEASSLEFKTGPGGLMDVNFLATGALLEKRTQVADVPPTIPVMLSRAASGPRLEKLLDAYRILRRTEARTRWVAGRAVEALDVRRPEASLVAELVEPGLAIKDLEKRVREAQRSIRAAYERILAAGSIDALSE